MDDMLDNAIHISGWVNGNLYTPTTEVLGILPIPDDIRMNTAMLPFNASLDRQQKHKFLAEIQGTRKPILPVHTPAEKKLFRDLMNRNPAFSPISGEPRWRDAVQVWNSIAERTDDISYKVIIKLLTSYLILTVYHIQKQLIEQLKTYYTKWKTLSHVHETLSLSANVRAPISNIIHDPTRSVRAPPVPQQPLQPHSVPRGLLELEVLTQPSRVPSLPEPAGINTYSSSNAITSANGAESSQHHERQQHMEMLARQRVATAITKSKPVKAPRKRRTCRKCAIIDCPGSQNVRNCKNHCRDCQDVMCRGRNPKRLDKTCASGWD